MGCVAVGWLVWDELLLVGGAMSWSGYVVDAVGWKLWGTVQVDGIFWVRAVGWPWVGSVVGVVGVVGVGWLVLGALVGCWLGWVLVWCGFSVGGVRWRFKIWRVMVAVGWRTRGARLGFWLVCCRDVGGKWGCVGSLGLAGRRWFAVE
jgi:hypothetical protein